MAGEQHANHVELLSRLALKFIEDAPRVAAASTEDAAAVDTSGSFTGSISAEDGVPVEVRVGINSGAVIGGVIGASRGRDDSSNVVTLLLLCLKQAWRQVPPFHPLINFPACVLL